MCKTLLFQQSDFPTYIFITSPPLSALFYFHTSHFASLYWLNSTVELKATNRYRPKHPKLKVDGRLLRVFMAAKDECDKEERDG